MLLTEELDLVKKAIQMGGTVTGCFEWHESSLRRLQRDPDLLGFTPAAIRRLAIEFLASGGTIEQITERRPEYSDYEFYYKAVVEVPEFPGGLFVEMRLLDPNVDCPAVLLVNAHPQRK
jgi:hypothetical protein